MNRGIKSIAFIYLMLCASVLVSCGGSDIGSGQDEMVSKVGVWSDGKNFVSISSDDFLTSYIASDFIDCGDVSESENTINCHNVYFNKNTLYNVLSVSKTMMKISVTYKDVLGQEKDTVLSLTKTQLDPVTKDNSLTGKSYTFRTAYLGNVTLTFSTYCVGLMTSSSLSCRKYPLAIFYIYMDGKLYFQKFTQKGIQVPTIGGWTTEVDDGSVTVYKLAFGSDGSVVDHDNITRKARVIENMGKPQINRNTCKE